MAPPCAGLPYEVNRDAGTGEKLNYTFRNQELLREALNHSSYANEHRSQGLGSNERLEFLGDSVLGFVTAEYLFARHPDLPEGI